MKFRNKITAILAILLSGIIIVSLVKVVGVMIPQKMVNPAVVPSKEEVFKNLLSSREIAAEQLIWTDSQITTKLPGNLIVLFNNNDELESQVTSLQFIISRSKIEGKRPTKIDLRFDKPIITY